MPKDILIAEHEQLFNEIRFINDKISLMYKFYVALFTSLIVYIFAGIKFYVDASSDIKRDVVLMYSILGILLTVVLYVVGHIASRQYAVSKKHRVRYWKAIHAIRKGFVAIYPNIKTHLIMPKLDSRPNISPGEIVTPYIFGMLNILFASIMFWFIYIWASLRGDKIYFSSDSFFNATSIFLLFIIITMLILPVNCAYYVRQLHVARKINHSNPYPEYGGTEKGKLLYIWKNKWLMYVQPYIVASVIIFYMWHHFYDAILEINQDKTYKTFSMAFIMLFVMCNNAIYMYPYFKPSKIKKLCKYNFMPCLYEKRSHICRCTIDRHCTIFDRTV